MQEKLENDHYRVSPQFSQSFATPAIHESVSEKFVVN